MSEALTGIYTDPPAVYAGQVPTTPDDGRVVVQARVLRASATRLDEIAKTRPGWSRSDALRHLLALGLDEYDRRAKLPPPRASAAHRTEISADLHAKLNPPGRKR